MISGMRDSVNAKSLTIDSSGTPQSERTSADTSPVRSLPAAQWNTSGWFSRSAITRSTTANRSAYSPSMKP